MKLFIFIFLPTFAFADLCDDKVGFEIPQPIYIGEHSPWADLKYLFEGGALVSDSSADFQQPGVCFMNQGPEVLPKVAVVGMAPAMATKAGAKFLVLLGRGYSMALAPWAPGEDACLDQEKKLRESARKYMSLPPDKATFSYSQGQFSYQASNMLFPIIYEVRNSANLTIVKSGESVYCAFRR